MKINQSFKLNSSLKLPLLALAISAMFSGQAKADDGTNVTLYARVIAGVNYEDNVNLGNGKTGSLVNAAGNQWGTSWWGIAGKEDLGGGLSAHFTLESGFSTPQGVGNGPTSSVFDRKAFVGLTGSWGTLNFGEDLVLQCDDWNDDPMGHQFSGIETLTNGRSWGGGTSNTISYITPTVSGFTGKVQWDLGGVAGSTTDKQAKRFELVYEQPGAFDARVLYDDQRDANGLYSSLYNDSKEWIAAGKIRLGSDWTLLAGYVNLSAPDTPNAGPGVPSKANEEYVGAWYQVSAPLQLIGAVYHTNVNNGGGSANLYAFGANYSLSKRTWLYATVGDVNNSSAAAFSVECCSGPGNSPLAGHNQLGTWLGIGMNF